MTTVLGSNSKKRKINRKYSQRELSRQADTIIGDIKSRRCVSYCQVSDIAVSELARFYRLPVTDAVIRSTEPYRTSRTSLDYGKLLADFTDEQKCALGILKAEEVNAATSLFYAMKGFSGWNKGQYAIFLEYMQDTGRNGLSHFDTYAVRYLAHSPDFCRWVKNEQARLVTSFIRMFVAGMCGDRTRSRVSFAMSAFRTFLTWSNAKKRNMSCTSSGLAPSESVPASSQAVLDTPWEDTAEGIIYQLDRPWKRFVSGFPDREQSYLNLIMRTVFVSGYSPGVIMDAMPRKMYGSLSRSSHYTILRRCVKEFCAFLESDEAYSLFTPGLSWDNPDAQCSETPLFSIIARLRLMSGKTRAALADKREMCRSKARLARSLVRQSSFRNYAVRRQYAEFCRQYSGQLQPTPREIRRLVEAAGYTNMLSAEDGNIIVKSSKDSTGARHSKAKLYVFSSGAWKDFADGAQRSGYVWDLVGADVARAWFKEKFLDWKETEDAKEEHRREREASLLASGALA